MAEPEQTDHRAEAERYLTIAGRDWNFSSTIWNDSELDKAMPTISRDDVPAGTLVYAPGPSEVLAYVNGKWWRQVKTS